MVGLRPVGVQQCEGAVSVQYQVVVDLVIVHIELFAVLVIGWSHGSTMMNQDIGTIGARYAGIKESDGWCFTKHMDGNEVQSHC